MAHALGKEANAWEDKYRGTYGNFKMDGEPERERVGDESPKEQSSRVELWRRVGRLHLSEVWSGYTPTEDRRGPPDILFVYLGIHMWIPSGWTGRCPTANGAS